jgi:hypothetical protein
MIVTPKYSPIFELWLCSPCLVSLCFGLPAKGRLLLLQHAPLVEVVDLSRALVEYEVGARANVTHPALRAIFMVSGVLRCAYTFLLPRIKNTLCI